MPCGVQRLERHPGRTGKLDETEKRITILQDQEGNVLEKPFMQENESEEDK